MESATWPVYSPFAREHYGKGREAGRAEGPQEGRAEGRVQGGVKAVLSVLEVRGIPVSDVDRDRITACANLNQLDGWMRRAVTATSTANLFGDTPERPAG